MKTLTVQDVLNYGNGTLFFGDVNCPLKEFSKDTRTIKPGDVYLGIQGDNFDGNNFYLKALEKGASCCILDHFDETKFDQEKWYDRTIVTVSDTLKSVQALAKYKRSLVSIPVVAVTGSVGKTSTKDMIASILKEKYSVLKSEGNLNGQLGLPLNILRLQDEEVMVLEMGMNDWGQISVLTDIAQPTIAIFTNIGTAHIGILGSRNNILKAKLEILEGMKKGSTIIINNDNDLLKKLKLSDYKMITCGIYEKSDYMGSNIAVTENKTSFELNFQNENIIIDIPVMGEAFVSNGLLAAALGDILGVSKEGIQKGLCEFELSGNRMETIHCGDITIINDCYNANYEAMESALDTLIRYPGIRKIAVLGDVLEMEEFAMDIHKKIGLLPSISKLDDLFLTGMDSKYIEDGAIEQGVKNNKIHYFSFKKDLENHLIPYLKPGDVLLIKASRGMKFEEIVEKIKESYCKE